MLYFFYMFQLPESSFSLVQVTESYFTSFIDTCFVQMNLILTQVTRKTKKENERLEILFPTFDQMHCLSLFLWKKGFSLWWMLMNVYVSRSFGLVLIVHARRLKTHSNARFTISSHTRGKPPISFSTTTWWFILDFSACLLYSWRTQAFFLSFQK